MYVCVCAAGVLSGAKPWVLKAVCVGSKAVCVGSKRQRRTQEYDEHGVHKLNVDPRLKKLLGVPDCPRLTAVFNLTDVCICNIEGCAAGQARWGGECVGLSTSVCIQGAELPPARLHPSLC